MPSEKEGNGNMAMTELPLEKAFMLIEPGPVTLVTTNYKGRNNMMTISWHMVMDFTPQIALRTRPLELFLPGPDSD